MEGEQRQRLDPEDLFSGFDHGKIELSAEQNAANLHILRDFVLNSIGMLPTYIEATQRYGTPLKREAFLKRIEKNNVDDAKTEALGDKTYQDKLGGMLDSKIILYAKYTKEVAAIILSLTDTQFQLKEVQKIINEVQAFQTVEEIPDMNTLNNRILELTKVIALMKQQENLQNLEDLEEETAA